MQTATKAVRYPFLRTWNRNLGSSSQWNVSEAIEEKAPETAVYRRTEGGWQTIDDLPPDRREYVITMAINYEYIREEDAPKPNGRWITPPEDLKPGKYWIRWPDHTSHEAELTLGASKQLTIEITHNGTALVIPFGATGAQIWENDR